MVIIRKDEHFTALMSDSIIGEHQAVLKPIDKKLEKKQLLLAASQLGDGNIAFMLDTNVLTKTLGN
jgi:two-component system, chemotaxis family, sensor kinase CheA